MVPLDFHFDSIYQSIYISIYLNLFHTGICHVGMHVKTCAHMSRDMRFPTMWYVRPAKPQISLRIRAV